MGLAGEKANSYVEKHNLGNSSLRVGIIDAISNMTHHDLIEGIKIEKV
jgi:hydroxyethylthiazole kinase-like sugar kinase family protein